MKLSDLRDHESDSVITTDVCVIGSGPAGATVALELTAAGIEVVIVESGGHDLEPETNKLYELDNAGLPRIDQDDTRVRQFGGTSTLWTGRCAPFRRIDFESRSWVPSSGWPFSLDDLSPYLGRASSYLGLAAMDYDRHTWSTFNGVTPDSRLDPAKLVDELWQFSKGSREGEPVRVNVDYREQIEAAPNLRTILHANVLEIVPNATGAKVDHVVVSTLEGKRATVHANSVVVAAGAIESARLLLASRSVNPAGLGNDNDLVGRHYMEHPYGEVGVFDIDDRCMALLERFGLFWNDDGNGRHVFMSGMALSPRVQRERELLNCAMYVLPEDDEDAAINAARRLASGTGDAIHDVKALLSRPMELAQAAKRRQLDGLPPIAPPARVVLGVNAEQRPDPDSRIMLSDRTDALGVPLTRIDWRMADQELATITTMFDLVQSELVRVGLTAPKPHAWVRGRDDWRASFVDTAHHSCSLRMASDPSRGVTDPSGEVYGVHGLFVAGSALFPTVGTANPTLMLTAMALRVADAVRDRHRPSAERTESQRQVTPAIAAQKRVRVGLVGSGHRAENVYVPILQQLDDQFELVGFTSRSAERREELGHSFAAPGFDSATALAAETRPDVLVVAVSGEANEDVVSDLMTLGVPLLVETPWARSVSKGRDLLAEVSSSAVIGVAEQFPFLPLEQLRSLVIEGGVLGQVHAAHNESVAWDYHGIAQLRRYLGPKSQPTSVQATGFLFPLAAPVSAAAVARDGYSATISHANGAVLSQRFVNFYDQPLRFNRHLTIDGELGTMVDHEVRYLDTDTSNVETGTFQRVVSNQRLNHLEIDLGRLGLLRWDNPFSACDFSDEQIAVATHLVAMGRAAAGTGSPLYSPAQAYADIEIMEAIKSSTSHGRSVSLPLNLNVERLRKATSLTFANANISRVTSKIRSRLRGCEG